MVTNFTICAMVNGEKQEYEKPLHGRVLKKRYIYSKMLWSNVRLGGKLP